MAIYRFDTPKGVLEFEHDGDPSELTGAVDEWVKGQEQPTPTAAPKTEEKGWFDKLATAALGKAQMSDEDIKASEGQYTRPLGTIPEGTRKAIEENAGTALKIVNPIAGAASAAAGLAGKEKEYSDITAGVAASGIKMAESLFTPLGMVTAAIPGMGLPSAVQKGVAVGFAADMASHVPEQVKAISDAGDTKSRSEAIADLALAGTMIAGIGKHVAGRPGAGGEVRTATGEVVKRTGGGPDIDLTKVETVIDEVGKSEPPPVVPESAPPSAPTIQDMAPAVKIGDTVIAGAKGEKHQDIVKRYVDETGDVDALNASLDPGNRIFVAPDGTAFTREQMKQQFGVAFSEDLAAKQEATASTTDTVQKTPTTPSPESVPAKAAQEKLSAAQLEERIDIILGKHAAATGETKTQLWQEAQGLFDQLKKAEDQSMGPGAASIEEFAARRAISIKNASIDQARIERGVEPITSEARRTNEQTWDAAMERINEDAAYSEKLVDSINRGERESVSDIEQQALLHEEIRLRNERDMEMERSSDPYATPEEKASASKRFEDIETRLEATEQAARRSGSMSGRALQIRQQMMYDDFTPAAIERRVRAAKGAPLTPEETKAIKADSEKITKKIKQITEQETKADTKQLDEAVEASIKEVEKSLEIDSKKKGRAAFDKRVLDYAERIVKGWDKEAETARERLRKKYAVLRATAPEPNPIQDLADMVIIARSYIGRGMKNVAEFGLKIKSEFGDVLDPYIQEAWEKASALLDKVGSELPERRRKAVREKIKNQAGSDAERKAIISGIAEVAKENPSINGPMEKYVKLLYRNFIESGMRGGDKIAKAIQDVLDPIVPGVTERDVKLAVSDYGKSKPAPTDQAKVHASQVRGEYQKSLALQDVLEKKQAPAATGQLRVPQSDLSRRLTKLLNEAKKKFNIQPSDPAKALKSALDSRKTYYRNKLNDLRFEIGKKERLVKEKVNPPTDAELESIKREYEQVKSEHDAIFGRKDLTDAQRLDMAIKATERAEANARKAVEDAKKGVFPTKEKGPSSPELELAKARVKALREEARELREMSDAFKEAEEQKKIAQTEKQIAELDRRLRDGESAPLPRPDEEMSPAREALVAERDAMRAQLQEMRNQAKRKTPDQIEQGRVERAQKALDELEERIRTGDIDVKTKTPQAMSVEREAIMAQRYELLNLLKELRDAAKPKKSPEEIALQSYKARLAREEVNLLDRNARADAGDATAFERPIRRKLDISKDPEVLKLKAEVEKLKQDINRKAHEYALAHRTAGKRILDGINQTRQASKNLVTAFDLSAPRQAFPAAASHPIMASRALGQMLKGWASEQGARAQEQQIRNRSNATNGLYDSAKVEFTPLDETRFTKAEENARSVLDDWAELPFRTGNAAKSIATAPAKAISRGVRMSNRAFITFLNTMRADLMDQLLKNNYKDRPPTQVELEALGNYVNVATGRGKLNPKLASAASYFLWAPKLLTSRFQLLGGQPLYGGSARTRMIVAKEYARILGSAYALWKVSQLFSNKTETDPRSSDFGKVVMGNTRVDLFGGNLQVLTLASRLLTKETKTLKKGEVKSLVGKRKPGDAGIYDVAVDFARTKAAPDLGTAIDYWGEENLVGKQIGFKDAVTNMVIPLSIRDSVSIMEKQGIPKAVALQLLSTFGAGVSQYEEKEKSSP